MKRYLLILSIITIFVVPANAAMIKAPGIYFKAWEVAYNDFNNIPDLTEKEKDLVNYRIELSEEKGNYIIHFIPNLLSEKDSEFYHSIVLGVETRYWINKNNFLITKRVFYKA